MCKKKQISNLFTLCNLNGSFERFLAKKDRGPLRAKVNLPMRAKWELAHHKSNYTIHEHLNFEMCTIRIIWLVMG